MSVALRLASVRERIARACDAAGRDPAAITLVAVSKLQPVDAIREAMAAGQQVFGENYAQELAEKHAAVPGARWHFIGHLQRNKARGVVATGAVIEAVDSIRLVGELGRRAESPIEILLQVDVAREASKSGCTVEELPEVVAAARAAPRLVLRGLMTVPPADADPTPWFRALRELAGAHGLPDLSMGMSADLETAISEGATIVRVGTAIFGPRPQRHSA